MVGTSATRRPAARQLRTRARTPMTVVTSIHGSAPDQKQCSGAGYAPLRTAAT